MKIILGLAALLPVAFTQSINETYLGGLAQTLNNSGLIQLATVASGIINTTAGARLLALLPTENFTVFAPDDAAFGAVPASDKSNATLLADVLSYHVVQGNFTGMTATYPNVTIGRTLLNDSSLVTLEGHKSQVVAWTNENGTIVVLNQATTVTVTKSVTYQNLVLYVVTQVLEPPGPLSTTLTKQNLTILSKILSTTDLPTDNTTLISALESAEGYTLFAPNDAALTLAASTISSLPNKTVEGTVLANHFINGTTVYSPSFISSSGYTSAAGEGLSFTTNSSGTYVTSGSSVAKVVKSDVLVKNGVVHIVDGVLANTAANAAAASSAYVSATSVAAKSTTETGPVGGPTNSGSSSSKGGAIGLRVSNKGGLVGVLVAAGGILAGGLLVV
jgi:uncharacterized surface protein with fasciclin (FAS1) repeats